MVQLRCGAFSNLFHCTGLTKVTIPVDLATDSAFTNTGKVETIHYTPGSTGEMAKRAASGVSANYYARTLEYYNRKIKAVRRLTHRHEYAKLSVRRP